jgi:alkylated DNA repair dioxygenase AlkB
MNITVHEFGTTDYAELRNEIDFVQRSVTIMGKTYPQPRLTRWYGDVDYKYSGLEWEACKMPPIITSLRNKITESHGIEFNSVLCNLYRDGQDTVGWHSDDEKIFNQDFIIASLSFGATRLFQVREKANKNNVTDFQLKDGTLLIMGAGTQALYQHRIPRVMLNDLGERINLTFRQVGP